MTTQQQTDLIAVELIKLKIQGQKRDLYEFKKRFKETMEAMDCLIMNETPMLPNMKNRTGEDGYTIFRQYLFIGMNRRRITKTQEKKT